jgi:two-component system, OmpR family, sensor histidine kinase KdpD
MNDERPDPELLLGRLQRQEELDKRAKLKIFFGAAAGVGKTFAMLEEAHERRRAGADVVVGVVETHGRAETAALLDGLEILPPRQVEYRDTALPEFDLDRALARRPALLLLDELAHTNVPGSRHAKRWQDVEELLAAGIHVATTLNVQHVESLYDIVAQITGVTMRETVPDSILDRADEIELVDLPPDDLLQRMREGKVYLPAQAGWAMDHFFKKGNLIALRELALRQTAERVDAQMESYREAEGIASGWPVRGRILVCIGAPEGAPRLVRAARRMAVGLRAEWLVVHVERPGEGRSPQTRDHLIDVMGFAEELGAETAILSGHRISDEILAYARARNASRIVVGKPTQPRWKEVVFGSLVNALVHESGDMEVHVISAGPDETAARAVVPPSPERRVGVPAYLRMLVTVIVCTLLAWLVRAHFDLSNLIMIYLLGVTWVAGREGRGPAIAASVLSVAAFDFFFVPPHLTFAVSDTQYLITFGVMLLVAVVISTMASRLRDQAASARQRERRAASLYRLSRQLASLRDPARLPEVAVSHFEDVFEARALILLPDAHGRVSVSAGDPELLGAGQHERGVAQWVFDHGQPAGLGTATLPASQGLYLPLRASHGVLGVLGIRPQHLRRLQAPDAYHLLEAFASQAAIALERGQLATDAEKSRVETSREQLRNALLSSVSHDLRTPLAVITGAASSLLSEDTTPGPDERRELLRTVAEESARLHRLIANLLEMTRLEAGALRVNHAWHPLEEIVGAALHRLGPALAGREVRTSLAADLPLVPLDDVLIEQVLFNLIENAIKYAPPGTPIEVQARRLGDAVEVEIADHGPGLPAGEETRVFEKFHRLTEPGSPGGVGLGLAICRGIVEAHGGTITASNRATGGASFRFTLPIEGEAPSVEAEVEAADVSGPAGGVTD